MFRIARKSQARPSCNIGIPNQIECPQGIQTSCRQPGHFGNCGILCNHRMHGDLCILKDTLGERLAVQQARWVTSSVALSVMGLEFAAYRTSQGLTSCNTGAPYRTECPGDILALPRRPGHFCSGGMSRSRHCAPCPCTPRGSPIRAAEEPETALASGTARPAPGIGRAPRKTTGLPRDRWSRPRSSSTSDRPCMLPSANSGGILLPRGRRAP